MIHFTPGKVLKQFTTKNGKEATIRYPLWEDLENMLDFINDVSQEDIFTTFSGEIITREGEMHYLAEMFKGMEQQNSLYLCCFVNERFAGSCSIMRDLQGRRRTSHIGIYGITIAKDFRGEGIGEELSRVTIDEVKHAIPDLRILRLQMYSLNQPAQQLYEKLGFVEYGKLPQGVWYRGEYIDEILMQKSLTE